MSLALPRYRIRMACNALSHESMQCVIQARTPQVWRGTDWQVEVALFWGSTLVDDLTNIVSAHLDIHEDETRGGAPLLSKTVLAAAMKLNLTAGEWSGGVDTNAHAKFTLTRAETNFDMTGHANHKKNFSLVVHVVTSAGYYITFGRTVVEVEEDGAQLGLAALSPGAYSFQVQNTDFPTHVHTVRIRGPVDNPQLEIDPGVLL